MLESYDEIQLSGEEILNEDDGMNSSVVKGTIDNNNKRYKELLSKFLSVKADVELYKD